MKSRQQLPANSIGFRPASNANCPQGFGRGWAVTPYATHFAGADWPMTSNRMFTRSRSPVPLRTITRGSFSAVADGVTVSPITPTTPFAVMTPDASCAVVRSHGAVVAPTAVSLDRNRGVAEGASPRSAPAEPEHATSNAPNRMTARTYSLHLPIYGGSPRGHVVYAGASRRGGKLSPAGHVRPRRSSSPAERPRRSGPSRYAWSGRPGRAGSAQCGCRGGGLPRRPPRPPG